MNLRRNLIQYFQLTDAFGWVNGTSLFMRSKQKSKGLYSTSITGAVHPIHLRSGTFDFNTFRQVFVYKEYNFEMPFSPQTIIDGGGNIGLASVFFANRFKGSQIFCIEPDGENFELLKTNTKAYSNIKPIQAGVWHKPAYLKVVDNGYGHWGFMVKEVESTEPNAIYSVSISQLIQENNLNEIDLLKLDIEGSEKEVLTENYQDWLPKTKVLVIELHDRMKAGTTKAFFKAIATYDFSVEQIGENMVCYRGDVWEMLLNSKKKKSLN
jgi:FkbM family methyltransferase